MEWGFLLAAIVVCAFLLHEVKRCGGIQKDTSKSLVCSPQSHRGLTEFVRRVEVANQFQTQGRFEQAQSMYDAALEWARAALGGAHPHVLVLQFTQTQSMLRKNDLAGARPLLESICEVSTRVSGLNHPATLTYMESLAGVLIRLGDHNAAQETVTTLLRARRKTAELHENASSTISAASALVTALLNARKWPQALVLQQEIVETLCTLRGPHDVETLLAKSLLGIVMTAAGDLPSARRLFQTLSGSFIAVLGREHPETLNVFLWLGSVRLREGDAIGSTAVLDRSLAISRRVLGGDHALTKRFEGELASALRTLWMPHSETDTDAQSDESNTKPEEITSLQQGRIATAPLVVKLRALPLSGHKQ